MASAAPAALESQAAAEITIDRFAEIDLRAGKVLGAERIPKADKLLKLTIDLGEGAPRTIVSGVAQAYSPEELVGRTVAVVANLPKKPLRGVESHGMVLFATGGPRGLPGAAAREQVRAVLQSTEEPLRFAAACALSDHGDPAGLSELTASLREEYRRQEALSSILALGNPAAVPALVELFEQESLGEF